MEYVIAILILLVPLIFRLIGASLEKSAEQSAEQMPQSELLETEDEPVKRVRPSVGKKSDDVKVVTSAPDKEEVVKQGEKIDPKKLVLYSEIMKPKFEEK